ncbi:hypothetical protein F3Y22_tig00111356pilonHSYRG00041 [Hibiscus syriacus]|uniref:RNA helicase n=1 Tax=Hibiscus syriacus TaxID=106335 RepID=A0A6A2YNR3_HIBSY|nr:hypothetical protein F3Y22_tig00111356pilonHSYRG00041 [Hibiscus syriacus]
MMTFRYKQAATTYRRRKTFSEIDLGDGLNQNIRRCNYIKPTPIQRHAIPIAVAGRDLMACAQTGSGKTAAFFSHHFWGFKGLIVSNSPWWWWKCGGVPSCLILAPTRELSCQGVLLFALALALLELLRRLERGVDLSCYSGRLADMIERAKVSLQMIKHLVLDEADRMLDMGLSLRFAGLLSKWTCLHLRFASDFLSDYVFVAVGRVGSSTDLIIQRVELVQEMDKRNHLLNLLRAQRSNGTPHTCFNSSFVETKRGADELERWLSRNGFSAIASMVAKCRWSNRPCRKMWSGYAFFSDRNLHIAKPLAEVMKESGQEVPTWLIRHAENYSTSVGGGWVRHRGVIMVCQCSNFPGSGVDDHLFASDMNLNAGCSSIWLRIGRGPWGLIKHRSRKGDLRFRRRLIDFDRSVVEGDQDYYEATALMPEGELECVTVLFKGDAIDLSFEDAILSVGSGKPFSVPVREIFPWIESLPPKLARNESLRCKRFPKY